MPQQKCQRVVIQDVKPQINQGLFPAKRVVGELVEVSADLLIDGHDHINANLLWKKRGSSQWKRHPMLFMENDRWRAEFLVEEIGVYYFTIEAWVDHFETWQADLRKKILAGSETKEECAIGASLIDEALAYAKEADKKKLLDWKKQLLDTQSTEMKATVACDPVLSTLMRSCSSQMNPFTYEKQLTVAVAREKALFSTWYEFFPRSCGQKGKHGTFKDCIDELDEIKEMGFDVVYLPPIHPIGLKNRKGKNNTLTADQESPGSPWAIGSKDGGHDAIHPCLGSREDFKLFVAAAKNRDLEVALDLAFQCAPDHPYVKEHPEWFKWRPDGTVQYAENPPKKYEDIIPFYFETDQWQSLWQELKRVVLLWVSEGIEIFRVDNPHTKPFSFWQWLITEVKTVNPNVLFLAEAFTRPKVMHYLAKIGFDQSYTYFTWRNSKAELTEYVNELTQSELRDYFRPNFWPNTPDILHETLQHGGRTAFLIRYVLAATLSSNIGIYGPAFELCINKAIEGKEEYVDSEKYEICHWDRKQKGSLFDFIALVNELRKNYSALQTTWNVSFVDNDNPQLLSYVKGTIGVDDILLVIVNLDCFHQQSGWVQLPLEKLGIDEEKSYLLHDLLSDQKYMWSGSSNYVELNPAITPAHVFRVMAQEKKEYDFDYYT